MKPPYYAIKPLIKLKVTVFALGKAKAVLEAKGLDPQDIARKVALHPHIKPSEAYFVRQRLSSRLETLARMKTHFPIEEMLINGRKIRIEEVLN